MFKSAELGASDELRKTDQLENLIWIKLNKMKFVDGIGIQHPSSWFVPKCCIIEEISVNDGLLEEV